MTDSKEVINYLKMTENETDTDKQEIINYLKLTEKEKELKVKSMSKKEHRRFGKILTDYLDELKNRIDIGEKIKRVEECDGYTTVYFN